MKSRLIILFAFISITWGREPQETYFDGDGNNSIHFGNREGTLDSLIVNPFKKGVNKSGYCAKYQRKRGVQYDNIKIHPIKTLSDVKKYSTIKGFPPKLKMKIYSTAPVGTIVELQLGSKSNDNYPAGVHSQYQAITSTYNKWEELTFDFLIAPKGSEVSSTSIDRITLLFAPGMKNNGFVYYFDELKGPAFTDDSITAK